MVSLILFFFRKIDLFLPLIVAQWKKLVSRVVTYKERTKGDTSIRREGSPVPGVELYDSSEGKF